MSTRISASMAKYSMGNPPFRRATNNKKLFPPIESLTKLYRGQPPCRNADCSAGAEPLGYLSIFVENCQEIKIADINRNRTPKTAPGSLLFRLLLCFHKSAERGIVRCIQGRKNILAILIENSPSFVVDVFNVYFRPMLYFSEDIVWRLVYANQFR